MNKKFFLRTPHRDIGCAILMYFFIGVYIYYTGKKRRLSILNRRKTVECALIRKPTKKKSTQQCLKRPNQPLSFKL